MTSRTSEFIVLFIFVAGKVASYEEFSFSEDEEEDGGQPHVDSRFFNIGGIINQLFPGLGQVVQNGPYDAGGSGQPAHNHFYPGMNFQGSSNHRPEDNWPIIDDASQYPSKGHNAGNPQQTLMPPQTGFNPQPQYPKYPNQWDIGSPNEPHYPSEGNIANPREERPNTNQPTKKVPQNQFPQGSQPYPDQGTGPQYPNEEDVDIPTQYPTQGGSQEGQFPNQGGLNQRPENDGTLNSLMPPDQVDIGDPSDNESDNNSRNPTAILGRPVIVPPLNTPEGQIFFPNSTESPSQRQCVQDCQSSSEYNPVCGSNNVTYFNPGKFVCARNCGVNKAHYCTRADLMDATDTGYSQVRTKNIRLVGKREQLLMFSCLEEAVAEMIRDFRQLL